MNNALSIKHLLIVLLSVSLFYSEARAQKALTKEQILSMSTEQLSELPLEDLMQAVETLGVSSVDELFALIMNKSVSSASKSEEDAFTSPLSSTVITQAELKTYGVTTLEEAFRFIPGVIVSEVTNGIYDIHIRGLNNIPDNNMLLYTQNNNTLLMIDGRSVFEFAQGTINFDVLPIGIEDVKRIEVVRGACSALYGANAVQGVINIITNKPLDSDFNISGDIHVGNLNTTLAGFSLQKKVNEKLALGLTANVQYRKRPTDKLYVQSQQGVFYAPDVNAVPRPLVIDGVNKQQLDELIASGKLIDASQGDYYTLDEVQNLKQLYYQDPYGFMLYNCFEPQTPLKDMIPHPDLARRSEGFNGYISFAPKKDIRFDLSGGYQNSFATATPVGDDYISFNQRTSKSWYVALESSVKDLKVLANFFQGPGDFSKGAPGFKINRNVFNASAEYDIHIGNWLIRPGISFQYMKYEDYIPDYNNPQAAAAHSDYSWTYKDIGYKHENDGLPHLSGFFNGDGENKYIAPSLRFDYKLNDFRFIAAFRDDKTDTPDKWNPSWQFAANYKINEKNFIRLVYGRANRSAILVNSEMDFTWTRTNMLAPQVIKFDVNKDADLVKIDNVELGYRWRPADNILIDAEVFFSHSSDYGAIMAKSSTIAINDMEYADNLFIELIKYKYKGQEYNGQLVTGESIYDNTPRTDLLEHMLADLLKVGTTQANLKYDNLPYKVNQFGLSLNIDWIVNAKLITKFNANVQKTYINDYYQYSESKVIMGLMSNTTAQMTIALDNCNDEMLNVNNPNGIVSTDGEKYYFSNNTVDELANMPGLSPQLNDIVNPTLEDKVEHKATPSFYGNLSLIYRPVKLIEIAASGNFMTKRYYSTMYNSDGEKLDPLFNVNLKVGYHPSEPIEVFFNAQNLFNNKTRQFVYADELGGVYTVGVNFKF